MSTDAPETSHPVVAAVLDLAMRPLFRFRQRVVPRAAGRVLEVGVGTGLNLPLYDKDRVSHVTALEPDPAMRRRARERKSAVPIDVVAGYGEALAFPTASFDTVVLTYVLCTVDDPAVTLAEVRRVLRPAGAVVFAEHVRSLSNVTARVQRYLNPLWTRCAGGCRLDRDAIDALKRAGFGIDDVSRRGRPHSLSPVVYGQASTQTSA